MRSWLVEFTIFIVVVASVGLAYAGPNEDVSVTPLRAVTVGETTIICKDFKTSMVKISEDAKREMPAIYTALRSAGVSPSAAPILIYKPGSDPQVWEATVAVPVEATAKAPAGYVQRVLPAGKAMATVYHGDVAHIGQAFTRVHQDLEATAVTATGELREHVLYWPGEETPNVVLLLEAVTAE